MNRLDEGPIIEAVLQGDLSAFQSLVERYQRPVYTLMFRATGSVMTAEDLTQDVFTRAYEKLHTFRGGGRFFPWLYTIAVNRCRDYLRRKGVRHDIFVDGADTWEMRDPGAEDCGKRADCLIEVAQVATALDRLPLKFSEPLLLYYREDFSVREIADALGITPGAAKLRIHRGRELLKRVMGVNDDIR